MVIYREIQVKLPPYQSTSKNLSEANSEASRPILELSVGHSPQDDGPNYERGSCSSTMFDISLKDPETWGAHMAPWVDKVDGERVHRLPKGWHKWSSKRKKKYLRKIKGL